MILRSWSRPLGPPIAVVALAYGLWLLSDRLLNVGPFDRATFGWLVVVPVWLAASVAAAAAWRTLTPTEAQRAALSLAILLASAGAILIWATLTTESARCDFGPRTTAAGWVVPALVVGALIGAAPALGGLFAARRLSSGQRWSAVASAVGVDLALSATAVLTGTMVILSYGGCQRPPV